MNKMSGIGFAIVLVILAAIGMIIITPTILDTSSSEKPEKTPQTDDLAYKLQAFENRINERLNQIEVNRNQVDSNEKLINKYICTIEGNVDENGNVVSVDVSNRYTKFVFVCEYRP